MLHQILEANGGLPDVCIKLVLRPRGLFLVTGPTGSDKSTTLASLVNYINENVDLFLARLNYKFGGPVVARY